MTYRAEACGEVITRGNKRRIEIKEKIPEENIWAYRQ